MALRPSAGSPAWGLESPERKELLGHPLIGKLKSAVALRPRMFEYYTFLRRDLGLPVLPIGLFLRVGLDGVGWDAYEEFFWDHRILRFEYAYVGLPGLGAEQYVSGESLLGVALSTLMRVPAERRAELYLEGLKGIVRSGENDRRRHLLRECLEAYSELDPAQHQQYRAMLDTAPYQEVKEAMITTFDQGRIAGRREMALLQLEEKVGPLSPAVRQRVEALSPDELRQLIRDLLKAQSLKGLRLED